MEGGGKEVLKEETLPPGFRFHPTDEELISYYLINKISDANFTARAIGDVDLNKSEPWDLPAKAKMGEKEWYFFSRRDRKYPTGVRTNRATKTGYWKTTGKDREIFNSSSTSSSSLALVGMKKTLVFYKGRAPRGEKTKWVMHEYRTHPKSAYRNTKDEWVVCRVFQKTAGIKKYPSNTHSRAPNPYPYNALEFPQNPQMIHPDQNFQFPIRNSYMMAQQAADIQELNRAWIRGGSAAAAAAASATMIGLPVGSQVGYGIGPVGASSFTVSGLNVNLGASAASARPETLMPGMGQHDHLMNGGDHESGGYAGHMNGAGAMNDGLVGMDDQCGDLENFWPSY